MPMIDRFQGEDGVRRLISALKSQRMVEGSDELAAEIVERAELRTLDPGAILIEQNGDDNDVHMIVAGLCDVLVNGRPIATRCAGDHVGEMAAIQPAQRRSTTIAAREETVVATLSEADFSDLAGRYPQMYRAIAQELARRLMQRNATIGTHRKGIRVFIISSVESLGVARTIETAFEHDPIHVEIWTEGTFKVASYTIESLEAKVDSSDFAIAIAHADDLVESRDERWPAPRDNVVFELGLFMGRLGRKRAILMEPRDEKLKLPSDFAGVTTIPYRYVAGPDAASLMGPACNKLRDHILELRENNA